MFDPDRVKAMIFDWGDTIMRDFNLTGPMASWPNVEWMPGAERVLEKYHRRYICVVATNAADSGTPEMVAALKRIGADRYFNFFFSSKELGHHKPDPGFFIEICRQIDISPNNCVMIGNDNQKDIIGAKLAGLQTVFFNHTNLIGFYPDADIVVNQLNELLKVL